MFLCITQISATLNLSALTSETDCTANISQLAMTHIIMFHTEFVCMFNIYLHTQIQTSLAQLLGVTTMFFYNPQKNPHKSHTFFKPLCHNSIINDTGVTPTSEVQPSSC
jgi:hypothetical protein